MEYIPPLLPGERLPDEDAPKKRSRWNVFEMFKKRDTGEPAEPKKPEKPVEAAPDKTAEKTKDNPDRLRLLARKFMRLIGADTKAEPAEARPVAQPETANEVTPEKPLTVVERAKQIGRNVLGLIKQTKSEVQRADEQEQVSTPTNVEPLELADQNVQTAMQELMAPINDYISEVTPGEPGQASEVGTYTNSEAAAELMPATIAPSIESDGYDYDGLPVERVLLQRAQEAASAAALAAREATSTLERQERRQRRSRKLGVAAAVGAMVYTWHRQKEIIKEQRAEKRHLKKFEAEVRERQEVATVTIAELERVKVADMSQPARQEYVHEVSQLANRQAAEIRTVARAERPETNQRIRLQRKLEPILAAPGREAQPVAAPTLESTPNKPAIQEAPGPRPTIEKAPLNPAAVARAERHGLIERLSGVVSGKNHSAQENGSAASGGGGVAAGLRTIITGQPKDNNAKKVTVTTPQAVVKTRSHVWLLGLALASAVVLALLFLSGIL